MNESYCVLVVEDIGDILVANPSVDYASAKVKECAGKISSAPSSHPIPLPNRMASLVSDTNFYRRDLDEIRANYSKSAGWHRHGDLCIISGCTCSLTSSTSLHCF